MLDFDKNLKKFNISKEQFFNVNPKNVNNNDIIKENLKCYTTYAEGSKLSKIFEKTKEKNMKYKKSNIIAEPEKNKLDKK